MSSPAAEARARRLERIKPLLRCPACRSRLAFDENAAHCATCGKSYPIERSRLYFIGVPAREDELDRVKGWLKRRLGQRYYSIGIWLLAPTYPLNFRKWVLRYADPATRLIIDAGSGNHRLHPGIICVDTCDYDAVDLVCDLQRLPFDDNAADAIVSRSVLEHVEHPAAAVAEFYRCTKPGGLGIHVIPFLFPFHASPADYHRYTHRGHDVLFAAWETVTRTNPTGPVTVLLLHAVETIATAASFGVERAKAVVYLLLCGLVFPLKFLDAPFVNRHAFLTVAASILSVVRKPV